MAANIENSIRDGRGTDECFACILIPEDRLPCCGINRDDILAFTYDGNAWHNHDCAEDRTPGHAVLPDESTRRGIDGIQTARACLSINNRFMATNVQCGAIPGAGRLATAT